MTDIWIKKVEIENFQSHKNTVLNFSKGTNALVGSSNSGKSAVIRAIKWCLLNQPSGTEFVKIGEEEAAVTVHLSNSKTIERRRGKKTNLYRLYENEELKEEYTGFGSKVPPDILEAHGIVPLAGDVYFQFAHQLESAFMLSLKPRQRAEVLGNLEELKRVDNALVEVNDDIRVNAKQKKEVEKEEKELTLEYQQLQSEINRMASKIDIMKTLKKGIEDKLLLKDFLEKQRTRLEEILEDAKKIQDTLERSQRIIDAWPEDLEERIKNLKNFKSHFARLKSIREELQQISYVKKERLSQLEEMTRELEGKIEHHKKLTVHLNRLKEIKEEVETVSKSYSKRIAEVDYSKLEEDIARYKVFYNNLNQLRKITDAVNETNTETQRASRRVDELIDEFVASLQKAKLCPTCGQGTEEVCDHNVKTLV